MTESVFTPHREPQAEPTLRSQLGRNYQKASLQKKPEDVRLSGCSIARDCGSAF